MPDWWDSLQFGGFYRDGGTIGKKIFLGIFGDKNLDLEGIGGFILLILTIL